MLCILHSSSTNPLLRMASSLLFPGLYMTLSFFLDQRKEIAQHLQWLINSIFQQRDYNIRVIGVFKKYVNTF